MNNYITIIDATYYTTELKRLCKHRPVAAIPFYGKYRLIDFALSSCYHSNCHTVGIFTSSNSKSLRDHIKSGKYWGLDRHREGLFVMTSDLIKSDDNCLSIQHLRDNQDFIEKSSAKNIVFLPGHIIINADLNKIVKSHDDSNADISYVYYKDLKTQIYIVKRNLILNLIIKYPQLQAHNINDVENYIDDLHLNRIDLCGNYIYINSLKNYFETNMLFLNDQKRILELTNNYGNVLTKDYNLPPTLFLHNAKVSHSVILSGSRIDGTVKNSILFNKITVKNSAVVKSCIIYSGVVIEENAIVEYAIIDKNCNIGAKVVIKGTPENIVYIDKNSELRI